MKKTFAFLILLLSLALAPAARSQFIGYTSPQTTRQVVFTNVNTPTTVAVSNLGQNMHFVSYTLNATATRIMLQMEGSNDGTTFFPISDQVVDGQQTTGIIYAIGYYAAVQVRLRDIAGAFITAIYSGTSGTSSPPLGSYSLTQLYQKNAFFQASQGGNTAAIFQVQFGSTAGFLILVAESGTFPAGSSVTVAPMFDGQQGPNVASATLDGLAVSPVIAVSGAPASSVKVSFVSGGGTANLFDAYYFFLPPGAGGVDPCQSNTRLKSSVALTVTTGTASLVAPVSTLSIYVCGFMATLAGTTPTVQFEYGTGATCGTGTAVLTGVMAPPTAAPMIYGPGSTIFSTPQAQRLCVVVVGAGGSLQGILTYVQQ
jgi:hypothetical protein